LVTSEKEWTAILMWDAAACTLDLVLGRFARGMEHFAVRCTQGSYLIVCMPSLPSLLAWADPWERCAHAIVGATPLLQENNDRVKDINCIPNEPFVAPWRDCELEDLVCWLKVSLLVIIGKPIQLNSRECWCRISLPQCSGGALSPLDSKKVAQHVPQR